MDLKFHLSFIFQIPRSDIFRESMPANVPEVACQRTPLQTRDTGKRLPFFLDPRSGLCAQFNIQLLLTEQEFSMGNLDRGREYRPNAVMSVLTSEVKILAYRSTKLG